MRDTPAVRRYVLLALFGLALLVRLPGLGARDLWYDEQVTLIDSQGVVLPDGGSNRVFDSRELRQRDGLLAVAAYSATHDQPVYISLIHLWTRLAGVTEERLRLPSALLGAASAPLLACVGFQLFGLRIGAVAGVLLAVSPLHVRYSQEARVYAVVVFVLLLALERGLRLDARSKPLAFAAWGAVAAAVPALHLLASVALLPLAAHRMAIAHFRRRLPQVLAGAAVVLVLVLPLGFWESWVTAHRESGVNFQNPRAELRSWARSASLDAVTSGVATTVTRLVGIDYFPLALRGRQVAALALPLVSLALVAAVWPPIDRVRALVAGGAVLPLLAAAGLSLWYGHVVPLQDRYSAWSLPFWVLLLSGSVHRWPARVRILGEAVLVLVPATFLAAGHWSTPPRLAPRATEARQIAACVQGRQVLWVPDLQHAGVFAAWLTAPILMASAGRPPAVPLPVVEWKLVAGAFCAQGLQCEGWSGPACPP
jgi:hypothetical protein